MKRIEFHTLGHPEKVLQVVEVAVPTPEPGFVRLKVTAANINPADTMFIRGLYGITPQLPSPAGFEGVGIVDDPGDGTTALSKGMRVIFSTIGAWQEYVCVPAKTVIPIPDSLSDEVACQAFVNPFTAWGMLAESGLKEGQWLLLTAGASAFSKFVIQLAVKRGIQVICTVRRDEQKAALLALGVKGVINTETESLSKQANAISQGGVDVVFDAIGGTIGAKALNALKPGGLMMVYGLLSLENIPLNSGLLIFKNLQVKGFWLTTWLASLEAKHRKEVISNVLGMLIAAEIKADTEAAYTLEEAVKALEHANAPGRTGKIIFKP
jgi:NADPH:quinone reductase-like Zn-dependent oxidoreductase